MTGDKKEKKAYDVFEAISGVYDSANTRISLGMQRRWKRLLVEEILGHVPPKGCPSSVLDVCCGTGDIALALAAARPDLKVVGVDFSDAMLRTAKRRREAQKGSVSQPCHVRWVQGNAMKLPFEDGQFAAAAISFGLRNTADYRQVLQEMKRVLRQGGYLFCLDSFVPEQALIKPFYEIYFRWLMPVFGGGKRHFKEYRWLWRSTRDFLTKEELAGLMGSIGLKRITYRSFLFGACVMHRGRKEKIRVQRDSERL